MVYHEDQRWLHSRARYCFPQELQILQQVGPPRLIYILLLFQRQKKYLIILDCFHLNLFWATRICITELKNPPILIQDSPIWRIIRRLHQLIPQFNFSSFKEVLDFSRCSFLTQNIKFFFCNLFLISIEACLKKIEPNHYSNILFYSFFS